VRTYQESEIATFEHRMGIALPEAYRRFLRDVGAGRLPGRPAGIEGLSLLEDWCQPQSSEDLPEDFLRRPFAFTEAWNDLTLRSSGEGWSAPYYDTLLCRGSMRIRNTGCEGYHLLVVSGTERGNVWADERVNAGRGIFPLASGPQPRTTIGEYLAGL